MFVVFIGPLSPPLHGQSIAFEKAVEVGVTKKVVIDINLTGKSLLKKILFTLFFLFKIFSIFLLRRKPDLVYFTCSRSFLGSIRDIILLQLSGLFKVPVVNHLHGADFKFFYYSVPSFYRAILKKSYNNVHHSIVLTDAMRDQFDIFPNMKISVVNNFFNKDLGLQENKKPLSNIVIFVFLSNIMKTKGVFVLLDAFKILNEKYANICLRVAGAPIGDYELNASDTDVLFNDYIKSLNRVKYVGIVQSNAKRDLLNRSSVFVLPSYYKSEAIPLSIIEAMASGCAIITTDHNYLPSLVGQDNGLLVKPNDVESLVEAMERYITSADLLGAHQLNNVAYASANFSEESYLLGIEQVLEQTLKDCR